MTIIEAVDKARENHEWFDNDFAVTVAVGFNGNDETTFDLYGDNKVNDLEGIWKDMHDEFWAEIDSVDYVEAHEYGWEG